MKRNAGVFAFVVWVTAFAGCATHGGDVDSESHFVCSEDGDCKSAYGKSICVSGSCEYPGSRQTVLQGQPGPAADCTTEWPRTTLRFETAEADAYQTYDGGLHSPRLNRNGTVIVGFTQTSSGLQDSPSKGHLIRWSGDTVSRFEQTAEHAEQPRVVSCDGMTILGTAGDSAYRWSANDGFALLPSGGGLTSQGISHPMALSPDGSTAWGVYSTFGPIGSVAIRWQGGLAEPLFTLDDAAWSTPGWSADGSVFVGSTNEGVFVQTAQTPATFLEIPLTLSRVSAVSFDGKVIAGTATGTNNRSYLWSSEHQLEELPESASVFAVTPGGVAVGTLDNADVRRDYDLVWDRIHGARRLREVLESHGLQLPSDASIDECTDISVDGRVITGVSVDNEGSHIFRAILPAGAFD